jgi:3-oxoacyl-[acyl-carrier protein] reductase
MALFENRRVLVTGSGRGIGKAIARRFALGGARVLLMARSRSELDESRAELLELTSEVHAVALDLTLPDSARQLVVKVRDLWGGLDILVTNAGAVAPGGFLELDDDAWPAGFALKLLANLRVARHAWPLLKELTGHLIMIGGGTARTPDQRLSLVSAVNGGIAALSKSIAEQGVQDGVHVNLVQLGIVKTSRRQNLFEKCAAQTA